MHNEKLYLTKENLFRFGNSTSSRLSNVRPHEITTTTINGIETIVANNNGVSVFNQEGLTESNLSGWVWEIKQGTVFPFGLKLIKRGSKGHFMLVPSSNMPLSQYIGLLEQVAMRCNKTFKKEA